MAHANRPYRHLYVHVPFCARRCSYCDFSIAVRRTVPVNDYVDAVACELRVRHASQSCDVLDTVYLGGGTPSRLGAEGICALLQVIRNEVSIASDAEVTIEANPEDIDEAVVAAWRESGINRLSIGVQSFDDRVLRWMHRTHDATTARRAVAAARAGGIDAFSLDLIFAVPESLERDWQRDVDEILSLDPEHVSLYGLTVEPHTQLGRWHSRGDVRESSEERYETEFRSAHARLTASGFEHYEVSNFAMPSRRARHNSAYWKGVPYLGVGPSAHGFDGTNRRWNSSAYAAWRPIVVAGTDPIDGSERLTPDNRSAEAVYLGLRTRDGLAIGPSEVEYAARWQDAGWVEFFPAGAETRLRCTAEGWLRLDALAADLTALRSRS